MFHSWTFYDLFLIGLPFLVLGCSYGMTPVIAMVLFIEHHWKFIEFKLLCLTRLVMSPLYMHSFNFILYSTLKVVLRFQMLLTKFWVQITFCHMFKYNYNVGLFQLKWDKTANILNTPLGWRIMLKSWALTYITLVFFL